MKRSSLLLVLALFAIVANAQLLWKVSGNGLARPSYILGTYHLAPASMIDEIPGMQQALEGCDIVIIYRKFDQGRIAAYIQILKFIAFAVEGLENPVLACYYGFQFI